MLPNPKSYSIYPSVILADKATEMTIAANERAFIFSDGDQYEITVISTNFDEINYHHPSTHKHITVTAKEGVIRFTYEFESEQEHIIILTKDEKELQKFNVFSVYEDLYSLSALRGDFHGHSCRSDGKRDPSALAGHYREQGYDFFTLTDHNRYYPGGEIDETYDGVNTGFVRICGEEVHAPGSVVHIVHACGEKSVTELYWNDLEGYDKEINEYFPKVPSDIPEKYKNRYARAMWATDKIHEANGLAIFAHPYWRPSASKVVNVCDEFAKILLKSGMFDVFELVGGMEQDGVNRAVALWSELRAEGLKISVVGSSDVHVLKGSYTFPHYFTLCFAKSNSREDIKDALKAGNTVAVEATGTEYERHYRAYGSLRLVTYAQFLLKYYFPEHERICQGGGIAMRAYAMGDAPRELVELQTKLAEDHSLRYFGRKSPKLPTAELFAFEDKWRERQSRGPKSRGSVVFKDYKMK